MTFDGIAPLIDATAERMVEQEIETLRALAGLNHAFVRLLCVWAEDLGVPPAARTFGLRVSTLSRLLTLADRDEVWRAPFSFATVDAASLVMTPPAPAPAAGLVAERHRLLDVVQGLFASVIGSYGGDDLVGLDAVFGQPAAVLRQVAVLQHRRAAWLATPGRWIVATPWLDLWVSANWSDPAGRYRVVSALLQSGGSDDERAP